MARPLSDLHGSGPVLIVERDGTGHRLYLVRVLAQHALAQGRPVTVALSADAKVDRFLTAHLGPLTDQISIVRMPEASWAAAVDVARELRPALSVVPDADNSLVPLLLSGGWRGPGELSLLVMRPTVTRTGSLPRHVAIRILKALVMTAVSLLPRIRMRVLRSGLDRARRSRWKPAYDPVSPPAAAGQIADLRSRWGLDADRYWFGILGAVTANKNVPLVVSALEGLPQSGLLIAGGIEATVRDELETLVPRLAASGVKVIVRDEIVPDHDFDAAMGAIDALVLAYVHNGPSGTLAKALAAGTRVVGAGSPALKRDAVLAGAGITWCPLDRDALRSDLLRAVTDGEVTARMIATEHEFAAILIDERDDR